MKMFSFISILIPIIMISLTFKSLDRGMRFLLILLLAGLVNEVVTLTRILTINQNHALFHIYTIFEVNMILMVLVSWFRKNLFWTIMVVFDTVALIYFLIVPITSMETYIDAFASGCILVGLGAIALDFTFSKINQRGRVLVAGSFAVYFSIMLFLYALSNQNELIGRLVWEYIHSPLNILTYLGVSYGIWTQYNSNKLYRDLHYDSRVCLPTSTNE